jgi:hypothetical protein
MNKIHFSILFIINLTIANAQNTIHVKTVETFKINFNDADFEKIYQSFSTKMKSARTKKYYFDLFSRIKKENGNLLLLEPNSYRSDLNLFCKYQRVDEICVAKHNHLKINPYVQCT